MKNWMCFLSRSISFYDGISFMICVATVMVCMAAILTPRAFQLAIAMFSSRCEVFYDAIALGGGAALDTH